MTSQEGIGRIIRNGAGAMVMAFAGMIKDTRSIEVELQALITGMDICYKLGHKIILIEGDCLIPVRSINECKNLPYSFMNNWQLLLLQKLKQLDAWEFKFCKRSTNKVADEQSKPVPPLPAIFSRPLPLLIHEIYLADM